MAVVDIEPPKMAAAENERQREEATEKVRVEIDEMVTAKAKLAELRARHSALMRQRDDLQTTCDGIAAKLARTLDQHANALGVRCDVCGVRLDVTSSGSLEPLRHVIALYSTATILQWGIGQATIAAMLAVAPGAGVIATSDRDVCSEHRGK